MKEASLWKRILHGGVLLPRRRADSMQSEFTGQIIRAPIIVDARPRDCSDGKFRWDRYTKLGIPFASFWLEGAGQAPDDEVAFQWGVLVKSFVTHGVHTCDCAFVIGAANVSPRWLGSTSCRIDPSGKLITEDFSRPVACIFSEAVKAEFGERECVQIVHSWLDVLLDSLMLLGCSNVGLDAKPIEPRQSRLAAKRYGGDAERYRYHTLVVRPPGAKSDSPGQEIGAMPRHVCRGHFAEYGPEFGKGLLFGRLSGRFFIPPHMKGDKKNGVVEKDYVIRGQ